MKLRINLQNCYGIKKLVCNFDFTQNNVYSIYAGNGIMKTSFAKTFMDLQTGGKPEDRMYPDRPPTCEVTKEDGSNITEQEVFVIESYVEDFEHQKMSTLLVNKELRKDYDNAHLAIDAAKEKLFNALKKPSGLKNGLEEEVLKAFPNKDNNIFVSLAGIEKDVMDDSESSFSNISYKQINNDNVFKLLKTERFKENLDEFMKKYDELIESSNYFKKGLFDHNNISAIAKNLTSNRFFDAKHSIILTHKESNEGNPIRTKKELTNAIEQEMANILTNEELKKSFDNMNKLLQGNKGTRDFKEYLDKNKNIIPELEDIAKFKQKLWISYLKDQRELYENLLKEYKQGEKEIKKIFKRAEEKRTDWDDVIDDFNKRFFVPFRLKVENQVDAVLNIQGPTVVFEFDDSEEGTTGEKVPVSKYGLKEVLSSGEKRALYLLDIIFEVKAREKLNQETLFIIDDIADSFDYKNKYAIISYLNDISLVNNFYQIILTHNFDFHRTVSGRLHISSENRLIATKKPKVIELTKEKHQKGNPFSTWKSNFTSNEYLLIASIPFVRNLAEYCGYDQESKKLTYFLHVKENTNNLTIKDLDVLFQAVLKNQPNLPNPGKKVIDLIFELAGRIGTATHKLENKIILSIAIRLKAEQFMIDKIDDTGFVSSIEGNQTIKLINRFKKDFPKKEGNRSHSFKKNT